MDKIPYDLIIGIVAGLVATVCSLLIGRYWKSVVIPWYEDRIYKDARINGNWRGETTRDNISRVVIWEIGQVAHRITANATPMSGPNEGKLFIVEGILRNLILTATYSMHSRQALDCGCLELKLVNNGQRLEGYILRYDGQKEKVESAPYFLEREATSTSIKKTHTVSLGLEGGMENVDPKC